MISDLKMKDMIARMILKDNYWGYLFSRIRRIADRNMGSIMGVCVDKEGNVSLNYHPELVDKTEQKYLEKIVEHEGMHLLNKHLQRFYKIVVIERNLDMKSMKMDIWNRAADCAANEQANIKDPLVIAGKPIHPLLPSMYNLKSSNITEHYYYELLKRVKMVQSNLPPMMTCSGKGQGDKDKKGKGQGDSQDSGGSGGAAGFDDHSGWAKKEVEGDPNVIARKMEEFMREIISDSIRNFSSKRGTLPSNIASLIDQFMKPTEIPYYQMIRKLVIGSRLSKFSKCYTRINRKRGYLLAIEDSLIPIISPFPGRKSDYSFVINLLIDTSGSMSCKDIQEALKSIRDIIENDRYCLVHVIENDACIQKEYDVKRIRDIQFEVKGRGGTTLTPGIDRCRELNADITLGFTDGYCEDLNSMNRRRFPKKMIWVITEGGTDETLNRTGIVVHLKKEH